MDYRHPDGHILRTSRTRMITVNLHGREARFPSTILDKQDLATLDQYGYRRIEYGAKPDNSYWRAIENSDLSTPGLEVISYTAAPRFTADEAAGKLMDKYYELAQPVVEEINRRIQYYQAIGRAGDEAAWTDYLAEVRAAYQGAVQAFQAANGMPTEEERYQALVDLYRNLGQHVFSPPSDEPA